MALGLLTCLVSPAAKAWMGFNIVGSEYSLQKDSEVPKNPISMPGLRSQDTVGVCYAFTAAALFDQANCVAKKISNCAEIPEKDRVSPLDISRFGKVLAEDEDRTDRFNYEGLNFGGSNAALTLQNAIGSGGVARETCAPFDQFTSSVSDLKEAQKIESEIWNKFTNAYNEYVKIKKKSGQGAADIFAAEKSKELVETCRIRTPQEEVLKAFSEDTYERFLDKALVPDKCWDFKEQVSLNGDWKLNIFPSVGKKSNYKETSEKIKEILATGQPVVFDFCAQEPLTAKKIAQCKGYGHSVVVTAFSKACNSKGKCVDRVKVHNPWGAGWQKNYTDDGWVEAKVLLDRSFYENQSLTWLSEKK
ncbi:hypothetical protein DOM22_00360 [Bdellovibrio sp. ZAP7]|uniref:hypothetical protein n=1 Tax=Bdellovibrio sp. ZAP7 TaxID=2231053 RepID=UPI001163370B|nr:hypothetical protein [Bdellovibrio sp. ZAP7]QDK43729.1 hypothetical protein DOM22_00360 [Bdellovibrio sp. ZAP7]